MQPYLNLNIPKVNILIFTPLTGTQPTSVTLVRNPG